MVGGRHEDRVSVGERISRLTDRFSVGRWIGSASAEAEESVGRTGRDLGSVGRRRIGPRLVGASTSLAVGIGDAVGIEVRQALHRSAGVTAGLRIDGS
ncbi:MAG: hypothetical protein V3S41_01345 [Spirochaetia bacterium]